MSKDVHLTVELMPSTCWFSNVRNHVDQKVWDLLRRQTYRGVNRKCAVCGGVGPKWPVECHELWEYDDERHVQKLVGLTGLCPACHEVKHMGLANTRGRGAEARQHMAQVNGWTSSLTEEYVADAFQVWRERSQHEWTIDLTWLEGFGIRVASRRGDGPRPTAVPRFIPTAVPQNGIAPETNFKTDTRLPSEVTDDFWVRAKRAGDDYPAHTERGGKWLVFVPTADVDKIWGQIKGALEAGSLGEQAKASTGRPNPNAADNNEKVICVYTYDGDDESDVWRVREGFWRATYSRAKNNSYFWAVSGKRNYYSSLTTKPVKGMKVRCQQKGATDYVIVNFCSVESERARSTLRRPESAAHQQGDGATVFVGGLPACLTAESVQLRREQDTLRRPAPFCLERRRGNARLVRRYG